MRTNNPLKPLTGDVCRIQVQYHGSGGLFETYFDYESGVLSGNPSGLLAGLGLAWLAAHGANFLATLGTDITADGVMVSCLNSGDPPSVFVPWTGGPQPGTVVSRSLPSELAATVTRYTAIKGQHGRGRNLLGPLPYTFVTSTTDPDTLNGTAASAYTGLCNTILTTPLASGTTTWTWCLTTRPIAPATLVSLASPIVTFVIRPILGTARRRKKGRGQ